MHFRPHLNRLVLADESDLEFPLDNVYFTDDFCHRRYTLEEAVNELRAHYEARGVHTSCKL